MGTHTNFKSKKIFFSRLSFSESVLWKNVCSTRKSFKMLIKLKIIYVIIVFVNYPITQLYN